MSRSQFIVKDEEIKKRNRNLFGDLMGHLKRAKASLESEKEKVASAQQLHLQQKNYQRIDQKKEEESREMREKQKSEIQEKRARDMQAKKEVELQLLKGDNELVLKKLSYLYSLMDSHLLTQYSRLTSTQPPLFWRMNRPAAEFLEGKITEHRERVEVLPADQRLKQSHLQRAASTFVTVSREYEEHLTRLEQQPSLRAEGPDGGEPAAPEDSSESEGEAEEPAAVN